MLRGQTNKYPCRMLYNKSARFKAHSLNFGGGPYTGWQRPNDHDAYLERRRLAAATVAALDQLLAGGHALRLLVRLVLVRLLVGALLRLHRLHFLLLGRLRLLGAAVAARALCDGTIGVGMDVRSLYLYQPNTLEYK